MSADHQHAPPAELGPRLIASMLINVVILVSQLIGGALSGSLALIADALHNLTDVASLLVSYVAYRIAKRPASERYTFAFQRTEVLAAVLNAGTLVAVSLYVAIEAVKRLAHPQPVQGGLVILFAAFGMIANAGAAWLLRGNDSNLNIRSAMLHLVSDSVASLGVLLAGIVIRLTGWYVVDPLVSLVLAAWIFSESVGLIASAVRILMQGVPENIDLEDVECTMTGVPGVAAVHDLHVWAVAPDNVVLSAHLVLVDELPSSQAAAVLRQVKRELHSRFEVEHATLEVDQDSQCAGLTCED